MNQNKTNTILSVSGLEVSFNNQTIISNVSFDLKKNETLAIIGPNGAGKTTLFKALLGLVPYSGKITWQKDIKIGYVPQKLSIDRDLPLTTAEFFALKGKNVNDNDVKKVLTTVGFEDDKPHKGHLKDHVLDRKIGILSGGEFQRILIAFALLDKPDVLLFDEPTSGIDISGENTIYSLLHNLSQKEKLTILLISHELQLVYKYATNVICLNKEKVCYGLPKDVFSDKNLEKLFGKDIAFYEHH